MVCPTSIRVHYSLKSSWTLIVSIIFMVTTGGIGNLIVADNAGTHGRPWTVSIDQLIQALAIASLTIATVTGVLALYWQVSMLAGDLQ